MGEVACARDIARLCGASRQLRGAASAYVRAAAEAQHGLTMIGGTVGKLRALEDVPSSCVLDFQTPSSRTVVHGSPLDEVDVGGLPHLTTFAQIPPAEDDEWTCAVQLRRGAYLLRLEGWRNPHHGVLDLYFGATHVASFDFWGEHTKAATLTAELRAECTGVHHIRGKTSSTSAGRRHRSHWVCLSGASLLPL